MVLDGRRVFEVLVGRKGGRVGLDIRMSGVALQAHPRLVRLLNRFATAAMVNIVSSEDEASRKFSSNIDQKPCEPEYREMLTRPIFSPILADFAGFLRIEFLGRRLGHG